MLNYAYGVIGDWLFKRVGGLEAIEPGYRRCRIAPVIGEGINSAEITYRSPYGMISSAWEIHDGEFTVEVCIPKDTSCELILPDNTVRDLEAGEYQLSVPNSFH